MPPPESRYERLDQLERLLASHPQGLQTGALARALGVGPDTIRRDLGMLEQRGTGLVQDGRRYLLDHRRAIHTLRLTTDQALALYLAARLLTRHSDEHNPHAAAATTRSAGTRQLADALAARTPELARHIHLAAQSVRARTARPAAAGAPAYVAALETLTRAWTERRKVRLTYRAITTGDETTRTFAPTTSNPPPSASPSTPSATTTPITPTRADTAGLWGRVLEIGQCQRRKARDYSRIDERITRQHMGTAPASKMHPLAGRQGDTPTADRTCRTASVGAPPDDADHDTNAHPSASVQGRVR